jgi:hypothetical protein
MSVLENRVKGPLLAMIKGQHRNLDPQQQAQIAFWAIKTSMMFALADPVDHYIPEPHYGELYEGRWIGGRRGLHPWRPMRKAQVMLSAYDGDERGGFYPESLDTLDEKLTRPDSRVPMGSKAYGVTMNLGHLVIQLFAHNIENLDFILTPKDFADASLPIWPASRKAARWPPPRALDDAGLGQLKGIFSRLGTTFLPAP